MNATQILHERGQSLWLDNITRGLLDSGQPQHYIDNYAATGLTSNPRSSTRPSRPATTTRLPAIVAQASRREVIVVDHTNGLRASAPATLPVKPRQGAALTMEHELWTLPDAASLAIRAAGFVAGQARAAIADHGQFSFAVSGGTTPWAMFAEPATTTWPGPRCGSTRWTSG